MSHYLHPALAVKHVGIYTRSVAMKPINPRTPYATYMVISVHGLSSEVLKLISNEISSSITLIINQTLTTGIFPDKLKIAKVVPIFKKDSKKEFQNYRPISVLPVISKIFESVIHDQLNEYFINNKLFCAQQYGFMKNASTELASLELIVRLLNQLNDHKISINLHLDLSILE